MLDSPGMYSGSTRGQQTFSEPMFRGLRGASAPVLSGMFARFGTGASVSTDGDAARVRIEAVSGDYFRTLGIDPTIGRVLGPDDDRTPDGHPVVVLSHAYSQNRFGGDSGVVGRSIHVNGFPMTIVGVAAPGFSGFDLGRPAESLRAAHDGLGADANLEGPERLARTVAPCVGPAAARRDARAGRGGARGALSRVAGGGLQDGAGEVLAGGAHEFFGKPLAVLPATKGRSQLRTDFSLPLLALMAMVAVVLLIACVNVANLLMARASTQQQEVAVRLAFAPGASGSCGSP